jgi:hypothetical protein
MWGSESKHATEGGLPEERKALALRYTVDAAEAQRRDQLAAHTAAPPEEIARHTLAEARETVSRGPATPGVTAAPRHRPSEQVPSLKERIGKMLHHREDVVTDVRGGLRANEPQAEFLRCARCGRECSCDNENWTLRLCGDDQLHPVCRGCDEQDFSDPSRSGSSLRLRPLAD